MVFLSICEQDADAGIKSRNQLSSGRKGEDVKFYEYNNKNKNNNNNINNNKMTLLISSHGISCAAVGREKMLSFMNLCIFRKMTPPCV